MAKLTDAACRKHKLLFSEGIALVAIGSSTDETYKSLIDKGLISKANGSLYELDKKFHASDKGMGLIDELLADSEEDIVLKEEEIIGLANKLREIYPEGKMPGTSYYYRCNKADIIKKLKSFFRRYGNYSTEQIIEATQRYVDSFNGNYTYLRLLKYFIWKDENKDGETLQISQLADWIENKESINQVNSDWMVNLK